MPMTSSTPQMPEFSVVRRGYAPPEVDARIASLERDLRAALGDQTVADRAVADLRTQLSAAQSQVSDLQQELDRQTSQPLTMSALSTRMQRLLEIAEEEAAEVRSSSDRYATEVRSKAHTDSTRMREETESTLAHLRSEAEADLAHGRAELEAEVARTRAELEDDRAEIDRTRTAVYEQAKRLMAEAHTDAERTLAEARAQAEHLSATAAADRAKQDEDYELAIEARRRQSHRAILEAEESSRADAQHRVEQATTHARSIVDSANAHAEDVLRRATAESHQRVADADEAVRKLVEVRADLQQQILDLGGHLADLTDTMSAVRKTLEPLPIESSRPRVDAFPADPAVAAAGRRSPLAALPEWNPPAPPVSRAWERVAAQLDTTAEDHADPAHDDVVEAVEEDVEVTAEPVSDGAAAEEG